MIKLSGGRIEIDTDVAKKVKPGSPAQKFVDSEVLRRCAPYVPLDSAELNRSGTRSTKIGTGTVSYNTPYARRWYYRPAKFQGAPKRGNYWFERMKKEGGAQGILKGVKALLSK